MQLSLLRVPTPAHSAACRPAASVPSAARLGAHHALPRSAPAAQRSLVARAAAQQEAGNGAAAQELPEVVVKIDNEHDPFATIVTVEFGDRLGELLDTVAALKNLGLNIKRAKLKQAGESGGKHKFYVTESATSEKVVKSARLEEIRLTILNMMMQYHPESSEQIAWAARSPEGSVDNLHPLGLKKQMGIRTQIEVREHESGSHSELLVNTLDRPGLLTDIVKVLKDINLNVVSAEVDTIGRNAFDKFNVTYHGEALPEPMCQLAVNALQYYLSMAEVEKEWSESY